MYFKKLEVFGFKSFPEKIEFVFEPGITAIVGPNGCGKTNVADAIRWVLGEQSALALRGSRMEDIIFNGSVARKPLGMAEVSLTLSNPENFLPLEYSEVTITRRVFRSGESHYFINRTPCRLRDINELFMDTGIGMESYSLIEQGKVDLILSSKPNDRRYLFEEAAGITKYKERKRAALRKLEATEENLLRAADIISEVKRQVGSLKRQVRKAERYQETFGNLKELEIKLALFTWKRLREEEKFSSQEVQGVKDRREGLAARLSGGDSRLEELRVKLLDLERVLAARQEESKKLTARLSQSESQLLLLRERREGLSREKKRVQGEQEALAEKLSRIEREVKETGVRLDRLSRERGEKEERVEKEKKSLEELSGKMEEEGKKIEESKVVAMEIVNREAKVRNDLAGLKVTLENLSARKRRLQVEKEGGEAEKERTEKRAKELAESLEKKESLLQEIGEKKEKLYQQFSTLNSQLSILQEKLVSQREELVSFSSRLDFIEDLKRRYEGYEAGVKAVLQDRKRFPGICGTVADLIDFPAELELALEAALGESVQGIVIKTAEIAEESIIYLREEKKGRAVFLPLNSLKGRKNLSLEKILSREGVRGLAFNLVNFDSLYEEVFSYLLGRTIIVRDLGRAREMVRFLREEPRGPLRNSSLDLDLVTLKGELVRGRGAVSGGSKVKGGGLLRRDKEIKELKRKVEGLKKALSLREAEEKLKVAEKDKLSHQLDLLQEKCRRQELEKAGLKNDYSSVEEERKRRVKEVSLFQDELREVEDARRMAEKEREGLKRELEELGKRSEVVRKKMFSLQQLTEKEESQRAKISRELTSVQVELASWEEKERSESNNLNRLKESSQEYAETQRKSQSEIEEADRHQAEIDEEEKKREIVLKGLFEEKESQGREFGKEEEEREKLLSAVREVEKELKEKRSCWEEIQDKAHHLDLQKAQLEMKMKGLQEKLFSAYQISLDKLFQEKEVEKIDEEAVSREIALLKGKLEAMGPVNLTAIEENKELEERYNFLSEQREDLIQAKESLQKVIVKINRITRSLFMETFKQVREHFNGLFRTLFGGGKADLLLLDETDILESGIDLLAQPPGKRLQSISLLSGGERALTALALLFALFKVKPSPFCLLDEIDAPLDDANINRFTGLLQKFTSQSQFIIITHNKRTIAMANVMYGVTMEEAGVSKLVSVRFREKHQERKEVNV